MAIDQRSQVSTDLIRAIMAKIPEKLAEKHIELSPERKYVFEIPSTKGVDLRKINIKDRVKTAIDECVKSIEVNLPDDVDEAVRRIDELRAGRAAGLPVKASQDSGSGDVAVPTTELSGSIVENFSHNGASAARGATRKLNGDNGVLMHAGNASTATTPHSGTLPSKSQGHHEANGHFAHQGSGKTVQEPNASVPKHGGLKLQFSTSQGHPEADNDSAGSLKHMWSNINTMFRTSPAASPIPSPDPPSPKNSPGVAAIISQSMGSAHLDTAGTEPGSLESPSHTPSPGTRSLFGQLWSWGAASPVQKTSPSLDAKSKTPKNTPATALARDISPHRLPESGFPNRLNVIEKERNQSRADSQLGQPSHAISGQGEHRDAVTSNTPPSGKPTTTGLPKVTLGQSEYSGRLSRSMLPEFSEFKLETLENVSVLDSKDRVVTDGPFDTNDITAALESAMLAGLNEHSEPESPILNHIQPNVLGSIPTESTAQQQSQSPPTKSISRNDNYAEKQDCSHHEAELFPIGPVNDTPDVSQNFGKTPEPNDLSQSDADESYDASLKAGASNLFIDATYSPDPECGGGSLSRQRVLPQKTSHESYVEENFGIVETTACSDSMRMPQELNERSKSEEELEKIKETAVLPSPGGIENQEDMPCDSTAESVTGVAPQEELGGRELEKTEYHDQYYGFIKLENHNSEENSATAILKPECESYDDVVQSPLSGVSECLDLLSPARELLIKSQQPDSGLEEISTMEAEALGVSPSEKNLDHDLDDWNQCSPTESCIYEFGIPSESNQDSTIGSTMQQLGNSDSRHGDPPLEGDIIDPFSPSEPASDPLTPQSLGQDSQSKLGVQNFIPEKDSDSFAGKSENPQTDRGRERGIVETNLARLQHGLGSPPQSPTLGELDEGNSIKSSSLSNERESGNGELESGKLVAPLVEEIQPENSLLQREPAAPEQTEIYNEGSRDALQQETVVPPPPLEDVGPTNPTQTPVSDSIRPVKEARHLPSDETLLGPAEANASPVMMGCVPLMRKDALESQQIGGGRPQAPIIELEQPENIFKPVASSESLAFDQQKCDEPPSLSSHENVGDAPSKPSSGQNGCPSRPWESRFNSPNGNIPKRGPENSMAPERKPEDLGGAQEMADRQLDYHAAPSNVSSETGAAEGCTHFSDFPGDTVPLVADEESKMIELGSSTSTMKIDESTERYWGSHDVGNFSPLSAMDGAEIRQSDSLEESLSFGDGRSETASSSPILQPLLPHGLGIMIPETNEGTLDPIAYASSFGTAGELDSQVKNLDSFASSEVDDAAKNGEVQPGERIKPSASSGKFTALTLQQPHRVSYVNNGESCLLEPVPGLLSDRVDTNDGGAAEATMPQPDEIIQTPGSGKASTQEKESPSMIPQEWNLTPTMGNEDLPPSLTTELWNLKLVPPTPYMGELVLPAQNERHISASSDQTPPPTPNSRDSKEEQDAELQAGLETEESEDQERTESEVSERILGRESGILVVAVESSQPAKGRQISEATASMEKAAQTIEQEESEVPLGPRNLANLFDEQTESNTPPVAGGPEMTASVMVQHPHAVEPISEKLDEGQDTEDELMAPPSAEQKTQSTTALAAESAAKLNAEPSISATRGPAINPAAEPITEGTTNQTTELTAKARSISTDCVAPLSRANSQVQDGIVTRKPEGTLTKRRETASTDIPCFEHHYAVIAGTEPSRLNLEGSKPPDATIVKLQEGMATEKSPGEKALAIERMRPPPHPRIESPVGSPASSAASGTDFEGDIDGLNLPSKLQVIAKATISFQRSTAEGGVESGQAVDGGLSDLSTSNDQSVDIPEMMPDPDEVQRPAISSKLKSADGANVNWYPKFLSSTNLFRQFKDLSSDVSLWNFNTTGKPELSPILPQHPKSAREPGDALGKAMAMDHVALFQVEHLVARIPGAFPLTEALPEFSRLADQEKATSGTSSYNIEDFMRDNPLLCAWRSVANMTMLYLEPHMPVVATLLIQSWKPTLDAIDFLLSFPDAFPDFPLLAFW
ncbi:hypothetical protein Dda_7355 [Drechslerella dactyloides]|uniref:Uncharacterized protein n=1 Tax=Drechslerella dactyloides TaxID=74499 RepID=A0AAD6IS27_DREDA|nr:hypothetical protein Dda_7355 [Drechslerella dactyloides]